MKSVRCGTSAFGGQGPSALHQQLHSPQTSAAPALSCPPGSHACQSLPGAPICVRGMSAHITLRILLWPPTGKSSQKVVLCNPVTTVSGMIGRRRDLIYSIQLQWISEGAFNSNFFPKPLPYIVFSCSVKNSSDKLIFGQRRVKVYRRFLLSKIGALNGRKEGQN